MKTHPAPIAPAGPNRATNSEKSRLKIRRSLEKHPHAESKYLAKNIWLWKDWEVEKAQFKIFVIDFPYSLDLLNFTLFEKREKNLRFHPAGRGCCKFAANVVFTPSTTY